MKHIFVPGPIVTVDGVDYYELVGYGLEGRLLVQTKMFDSVSVDYYDDFVDGLIQKELTRQQQIHSVGRK